MSSAKTPCAACKTLRRKCINECVFAPYFPPDQPHKFETVHRVYGASNVAKILSDLPASERVEAVASLVYEADARLKDPIYGCVGTVSILQHRLKQIQAEIQAVKQELATYVGPSSMDTGLMPQLPNQHPGVVPVMNSDSEGMMGTTDMLRKFENHQQQIRLQQQSMDLAMHNRRFEGTAGQRNKQLYEAQQQLVDQDMLRKMEHQQRQQSMEQLMCNRSIDGAGPSSHATHSGSYDSNVYQDPRLQQLIQRQLLLQQQNQPSQPQPNYRDGSAERSNVDPQ